MTPQQAAELYQQFKNGTLNKKTKQMLIGYLEALRERHRLVNNLEAKKKVEEVLKELRAKVEYIGKKLF